MPSSTDVVNHALDMAHVSAITDLDAADAKAKQCKRIYEFSLPIILGKDDWYFSKGKVSIAVDDEEPLNEWTYAYTMPADCVKPLRLNDDDSVEWEAEGRKILTDATSPIILDYLKLSPDPNQWDTGFLEAFTTYLASRYCKAFPQDNNKAGEEYKEYKETLGEAIAKNGQTGTPPRPTVDALTTGVRRY